MDRIFKIFTRDRPERKGFDQSGKPAVSPRYGSASLNYKIRRDKANEINQRNIQIVKKLQTIKPKVITYKQCEANA